MFYIIVEVEHIIKKIVPSPFFVFLLKVSASATKIFNLALKCKIMR